MQTHSGWSGTEWMSFMCMEKWTWIPHVFLSCPITCSISVSGSTAHVKTNGKHNPFLSLPLQMREKRKVRFPIFKVDHALHAEPTQHWKLEIFKSVLLLSIPLFVLVMENENTHIYMYIYISIYIERERERDLEMKQADKLVASMQSEFEWKWQAAK